MSARFYETIKINIDDENLNNVKEFIHKCIDDNSLVTYEMSDYELVVTRQYYKATAFPDKSGDS